MTRAPAKITTLEQLRGVAGREMTYELPLSSISSCSQFSGRYIPRCQPINIIKLRRILCRTSWHQDLAQDILLLQMKEARNKDDEREAHFSPLSVISSANSNQSGELELHGYRSRPIIPPSLNDLDLPPNHMNVFMTIPVAKESKKKAQKATRQDDSLSCKYFPPVSTIFGSKPWRCQCINILHIREPGIFSPQESKAQIVNWDVFSKKWGSVTVQYVLRSLRSSN